MKLIVAGATGFVGTAVIRQAIHNPAITSIIALARRKTTVPKDAGQDASKVKSVILDDFTKYPENVKSELAGAHACIWLLAITPAKSSVLPWEEVRRICYEYTAVGIDEISSVASKPFRFSYVSGSNAERDQTKKPWVLGDYILMRGRVESHVLNFAKESKGDVEACVAKPGMIEPPGGSNIASGMFKAAVGYLVGVPRVGLEQVAATLINQAVGGFEKETLLNEDLVRIGSKVLEASGNDK
ncbi:putative nucleoside-diphosphate-sugar epimerase [Amylocarpus encephaloides]|uniref:Nucleoside-diphosphate-sugar epimerase n=1 Tax=Amylocarpus encephaloides TaxID=45428 RepID=A0A9P8C608_9HELO|nr:putative nucleoside-diphosphate-sugar epimerase [Amylocarpus encephaloides]